MNERLESVLPTYGLNGEDCEGNRAPAGVRFPSKQEAAGSGEDRRAMGTP
jgi:hypothetical protein